MSKKKNGFIMQAAILAVAGILVRIIGVLYRSPLNNITGDTGYGYYNTAYNIYAMILLISSYSIPTAISKVISARLALKEYKNAHNIFHCALIYVAVVGGIAALFTYIFAPFLVLPSCVPALRTLAPTIFFSGFLGVFRGYFQAHGTMIQTSVSQILEQIFNAIFSIGVAYALTAGLNAGTQSNEIAINGSVGGAVGTGAGVLTGLLFMFFVYFLNRKTITKKVARDKTHKLISRRHIFGIIISMVTPVILSTFIYNISTSLDMTIYQRIIMHVKGWTEETISAHYGVFSGKYMVIINIPVALASAISSAMIPGVSANFAKNDIRTTNAKIKEAIQFTMIISIPCAIGLAVLAEPIMMLLFPQPSTLELSTNLLQCGSMSVIFYSLSTVTNAVLQGIGRVNIPIRNAAIALVLHLGLLIPLLYYTDLDVFALMLATIFYSLLMCILNASSVRKHLAFKQDLVKTFLLPGISAIAMGAVAYGVYYGLHIILPYNIICLALSIGCAAAVYFVLLIKTGTLTEEELLAFPKGGVLIRIARKMHLLHPSP